MAHGHEDRIRELERRYGIMGNDLRSLRQRATAAGEGIRGVWIDGLGLTPATTPPCITYYLGTINGMLSTPTAVPGSSFTLTGHTTGRDYGTYLLPTGFFYFGIDQDRADTTLDWSLSGPGVRWLAPKVDAAFPGGSFCGTNGFAGTTSGFSHILAPATGYARELGLCNFPLSLSLTVADSVFGAGTVTNPGGNSNTWTGFNGGTTTWTFLSGGVASTGDGTGGPAPVFGTISSLTVPDAGATLFDATWTCTVAGLGYVVGDTIRIHE
jgi:hypothetical protein